MVDRDALTDHFSILGVEVSKSILDKCEEICTLHNVEEEELVEMWMAFTLSHLNGADPTVDLLTQMERKTFAKPSAPGKSSRQQVKTPQSSSLLIYNTRADTSLSEENILDVYQTTPKAKGRIVARNDLQSPLSSRNAPCPSPSVFSPAGYSPTIAITSQNYAERTNALNVELSVGQNADTCTWKPAGGSAFVPKVAPHADGCLGPNVRYMFEMLPDERSCHSNRVDYLSAQIMKKHLFAESESTVVPFQEAVLVCGRVCGADEGRLTKSGVRLEGPLAACGGRTVSVSLDKLRQYSLFPGQTVVARATNPTGALLVPEQLYDAAPLPPPKELPAFTVKNGPLQLVIAAGPFTQMDTLNYQPLQDLIQYVVQHRPHVLILVGPFLDAAHPHVTAGLLADTFDAHFEKMLVKIAEPLKMLNVQIVVVASSRDAHHAMVYPTPPYSVRKCPANITLLPDPCTIDIQGLVVGVTATDIVKHLASQEISVWPAGQTRLHRLARHLLSQQSFYPLYPPAEETNIDTELFNSHACMDVTPHILVLPSDMRHFILDVDDCFVVNPERLAKGSVGGCFARIEISPPTSEKQQDFIKNISCNVLRI